MKREDNDGKQRRAAWPTLQHEAPMPIDWRDAPGVAADDARTIAREAGITINRQGYHE